MLRQAQDIQTTNVILSLSKDLIQFQMLRQAQYDIPTMINFVELASSVVTLSLSKGLKIFFCAVNFVP